MRISSHLCTLDSFKVVDKRHSQNCTIWISINMMNHRVHMKRELSHSRPLLLQLLIRAAFLEARIDSSLKGNRCLKRHAGNINFIPCFANSILSCERKFAFVTMHCSVTFHWLPLPSSIFVSVIITVYRKYKFQDFHSYF